MAEESLVLIDSTVVMAYLIQRCRMLGVPNINVTKMQKLMYCCYGVCMAKFRCKLGDESPEAWQYGPVFPRTLRELQVHGIDFVASKNTDALKSAMPEGVVAMIDATLRTFGKFAANQLSNWSHIPGSPWFVASLNGQLLREQISDSLIADYFSKHVLKQQ